MGLPVHVNKKLVHGKKEYANLMLEQRMQQNWKKYLRGQLNCLILLMGPFLTVENIEQVGLKRQRWQSTMAMHSLETIIFQEIEWWSIIMIMHGRLLMKFYKVHKQYGLSDLDLGKVTHWRKSNQYPNLSQKMVVHLEHG